jgi:C4-dicarboxylate-binding protein DctP
MSALHGEVFRALGFEPIAADIKRFVAEIGGDSFDAHDNPLTNIYTFGVHRYHRHVTLTSHFFGATFLIANAREYASWPAEVQAAAEAAAPEAIALQRRLAASEDADVLAKLRPGENEVVHLTAAEHAAFVEACRPLLDTQRRQLDPKLFSLLEQA